MEANELNRLAKLFKESNLKGKNQLRIEAEKEITEQNYLHTAGAITSFEHAKRLDKIRTDFFANLTNKE